MPSKTKLTILTVFLGISLVSQGCGVKSENPDVKVSEQANKEVKQAGIPTQPSPDAPKNVGAKPFKEGAFKTFKVYTDGKSPDNHYVPSGWMGDYGDITIDDKYMDNPHAGTTCFKIVYNGKATQGARWAGIYWQNPPNNWGTRPGGYDLTGAKKLTFWARGEKGGERIEEFKIGGITGEYADSDVAGIGPVVLTKDWQQFTIDLEGKDLSSISGGFCWATNLDVNPEGCTFYLDDIKYE